MFALAIAAFSGIGLRDEVEVWRKLLFGLHAGACLGLVLVPSVRLETWAWKGRPPALALAAVTYVTGIAFLALGIAILHAWQVLPDPWERIQTRPVELRALVFAVAPLTLVLAVLIRQERIPEKVSRLIFPAFIPLAIAFYGFDLSRTVFGVLLGIGGFLALIVLLQFVLSTADHVGSALWGPDRPKADSVELRLLDQLLLGGPGFAIGMFVCASAGGLVYYLSGNGTAGWIVLAIVFVVHLAIAANLSTLYLALGKPRRALDLVRYEKENSQTVPPLSTYLWALTEARCYLKLGDLERARARVGDVLGGEETNLMVQEQTLNLAETFLDAKDAETALTLLDHMKLEILKGHRKNRWGLLRGETLLDLDRPADAQQALERLPYVKEWDDRVTRRIDNAKERARRRLANQDESS